MALITLVVGPQAEHYLRELKEITENEATIAGVKAGQFRDLSGGRRVFYAAAISADGRYLEQAFVHSRDKKSAVGRAGTLYRRPCLGMMLLGVAEGLLCCALSGGRQLQRRCSLGGRFLEAGDRARGGLGIRQRLGAFLQRKGYAYETVRAVVATVQAEQDAPAEASDDEASDDLA